MKHSKKYSSCSIGFVQALGVTLYVSLIASVIRQLSHSSLDPDPLLGMSMFLLLFVFSALVCGSMILGYPATIFFDNKRKEALQTIGWSALWLAFFLSLIICVVVGLYW